MKTFTGRCFEDFRVGDKLAHAVPRTLHGGDIAAYMALTGDRNPLASSTELARSLGFTREVVPELLAFHIVFGMTVPDVSHRATANLGYADVRFLRPVYPGDTLVAESEVIGLREVSSGDAGVVYVRSRGSNQKGQDVVTFARWVLVPKRDGSSAKGVSIVPELPETVTADRLPSSDPLHTARLRDLAWAFLPGARWDDYAVGERIDHPDAMTIDEADHMQATRLYHNTAQVHFDAQAAARGRFGKRIVYGGHVISVALALAQNGLGTALRLLAWNAGKHVAPTFAGDTIRAATEVVECAELGRVDIGALRLKTTATKNGSDVVLELDYWMLLPRG